VKNTKDKILEAAMELFASNGYKRTSINSIANKSGVNESTIFRTFGSKKQLFGEVFLMLTPDTGRVDLSKITFGVNIQEELLFLFKNYMILHIEHMPAYRLSMLIDEIYNQELYYTSFCKIKGLINQLREYLETLYQAHKIRYADYSALSEYMFSIFLVKAPDFIKYTEHGASYNEDEVTSYITPFAKNFATFLTS
jgi:AcrR family transcriptional regulator